MNIYTKSTLRNKEKLVVLLTITAFFVTSCGSISAPTTPTITNTPSPTLTPTATFTPTNTPTPTATNTPTLTPTNTPLPEELLKQIQQSYSAMILIQATAELTDEYAARIQAGELSGLQGMAVLIFLAAMIQGIDETIPDITPPEYMVPYWEQLLDYKDDLKDILARWVDDQITSSDVLEELVPLLEDINDAMAEMESVLASEYDRDPAELTKIQEDMLEELRSSLDELNP